MAIPSAAQRDFDPQPLHSAIVTISLMPKNILTNVLGHCNAQKPKLVKVIHMTAKRACFFFFNLIVLGPLFPKKMMPRKRTAGQHASQVAGTFADKPQ